MTTTDLDLRGMSCASCAARVEGALNRLDGVRAAVNFALERAHVQHESEVSAGDLIRVVESPGYHASVAVDLFRHDDDEPQDRLRLRLIGSALLRLQHRGYPTGRDGSAQPDDRRCGDGLLVATRGGK